MRKQTDTKSWSHVCNEKDPMHQENHPLQSLLLCYNLCDYLRSNHHLNMYRVHNVFTVVPEAETQRVIKYIVRGRWHRNHDGPDGLQKSGNVPESIHHQLLDLSYSCGNDPFPALPHHPHITALNTTQNPALTAAAMLLSLQCRQGGAL